MQFANDYEYLIHLVKCAIFDLQPQEKPADISFLNVFSIGKKQEVGNMAFFSIKRLENKPDAVLYKNWEQFYLLSVRRNILQQLSREKTINLLHSKNIRTLEVQGSRLKELYPYPEFRMMSDIDIIIDKQNYEAAFQLLSENGYNCAYDADGELCAVDSDGLQTELHPDFFNSRTPFYKSFTDPFSFAETDDGLEYIPTKTAIYTYNLLHCLKHFSHKGIGIRRILDLYLLNREYKNSVDDVYVDELLEKYNMKQLSNDLFALADVWFGDKEKTYNLDYIINSVYSSGVHGSAASSLYNAISLEKGKSKLSVVIHTAFPDKKTIYMYYPKFKKFKLPLIICWILRFFIVIFNPKKYKGISDKLKLIKQYKK